VRVRGFVDDLEAVYAEMACAVVPLLTGGGSPLKFVEAIAHGLPVAATARAARGLEVTAGEHFLLGDGPAEFADAVIRALDPTTGARIGAAARALAEREYSIESLAVKVAP
jgi:glycosyltransferase involved in cell wall biosynthesis